jgi:hypothetical protein
LRNVTSAGGGIYTRAVPTAPRDVGAGGLSGHLTTLDHPGLRTGSHPLLTDPGQSTVGRSRLLSLSMVSWIASRA